MKKRLLCLFLLLDLIGLMNLNGQSLSDSLVRFFNERDAIGIDRILPVRFRSLSLEEGNKVGLAAAKSLNIGKYIDAIPKDSTLSYLWTAKKLSPEELECRKQWQINRRAVEFLDFIAESRLIMKKEQINDPRVIPFLIEALDYPDPKSESIPRHCIFVLCYLTGHNTGRYYVGDRDNIKDRPDIKSWWRDWWKKNKDNHPVFDNKLETRARTEVCRLAQLINTKLKPSFPELEYFPNLNNSVYPMRHGQPVFVIDYDPVNWSLPGFHYPLTSDSLPWILISCRFRTEDIPEKGEYKEKFEPSPELVKYKKICYSRVIEGTDLLVEVLVASKNQKLLKETELVLNQK